MDESNLGGWNFIYINPLLTPENEFKGQAIESIDIFSDNCLNNKTCVQLFEEAQDFRNTLSF